MRSWAWAMAATVLAAAAAPADYVYIRDIMGGPQAQDPNNPNTPPGGNPNQPPGSGQPPAGGSTGQDVETEKFEVMCLIDGKTKATPLISGRVKYIFTHRWGQTSLYNEADKTEAVVLPVRSPASAVDSRFDAVAKSNKPNAMLDAAEFALHLGEVDQFEKYMGGLAQGGRDFQHKPLDDAIAAFKKLKPEIAKRIDREGASQLWRGKLSSRMMQSDHYSLLYMSAASDPPEVKERLEALERHFKLFYYWFAMQGIALPMPDEKLVAVMIDDPTQFVNQLPLGQLEPLVSDGYYAPRDHVLIFSAVRLDAPSQLFKKKMSALYLRGWERKALLEGKGASRLKGEAIDESYRMQTLALLDRCLEVESERAAVSHEGTKQLAVATGLLPKSLIPPQWADFGLASVFEMPKGPFPLATGPERVAPWAGVGAPNWLYSRLFRALQIDTIYQGAPPLLLQVISDEMFDRSRSSGHRDFIQLITARTTAWGLSYYLVKTRLPGLKKYYEELAQMPRDLQLDPKLLRGAFARAFDLANADGTDIDPSRFANFARDWIAFMKTVPVPGSSYGLSGGGGQPGPGGQSVP